MKALVISTVLILMIPTVSFANPSLGSTAYENVSKSNKKLCQSIPTAKPTGGATRQRLQALQHCNKKVQQFSRESNTGEAYQSPIAEPSGGATRQRLQGRQR